jgi:hypothetical protein
MKKMVSQENLWALVLAFVLVALVIFTASDAPLWIYQGF